MSLYVRVFSNFYTHRKTVRLRVALGNDALWIPPRIWAYAAENQPDGDFSAYEPAEIAALIGYAGDAKAMLQALLRVGFLDRDPLRIHDWHQHNGFHRTWAARASKAAKARWDAENPPVPPSETGQEKKRQEASIACNMLQASAKHAQGSVSFEALQAFRQELNEIFKQPTRRWTDPEERELVTVVNRPEHKAELTAIREWRSKLIEKQFFPHSVLSLLERWSSHLDKARTYTSPLDKKAALEKAARIKAMEKYIQ